MDDLEKYKEMSKAGLTEKELSVIINKAENDETLTKKETLEYMKFMIRESINIEEEYNKIMNEE